MKSFIQSIMQYTLILGLVIMPSDLLKAQSNTAEQQESILHITGYAYTGFQYDETGASSFNIGSFSPIFHFLYKDILLMETELEVGAGENGSTEVALEYLTLDLFLNDYVALVLGKYISPVGQFKQNLHPSWINKLPSAPVGFGHDGVTPAADIGVQLRGGIPFNSARLAYAFALENGPQYVEEEDGHDAGVALSHDGFAVDNNSGKVFSGRIAILPKPNYSLAVSFSNGSVISAEDAEVDYGVIGFDYVWNPAFNKNIQLRAEYVDKVAGDEKYNAYYAQASYLLPLNFESVVRYSNMDNNGETGKQLAVGVNYLFSNNVITKFAYEFNESDEMVDRFMIQLAFGF